ncbi:acyl-CoA N-acyltransferase [Cercophora newfieldiana]|uniref:Acyl-CoA N-acyltransferase n=1 Tax=Cercophora newfieldiana TaxID=92897 RepID=A0AA39YBL2_9PEZI|nr:acyl-CoA N-acyltransferase [Cercophora newfieldiana]
MSAGPYPTVLDFISNFLEKTSLPDPGMFTFAVIDKTRPPSAEDDEGQLAGMMSFASTSPVNLVTEIGYVMVLPAFHRTHVTTNAVGLMLKYALDGPYKGGLGLVRVHWQTSTANVASLKTAERMGFRREALLRWHMMFRDGVRKHKVGNGRALPPGSNEGDVGRDTVVLSLCWDDWEQGGRERVEKIMARID